MQADFQFDTRRLRRHSGGRREPKIRAKEYAARRSPEPSGFGKSRFMFTDRLPAKKRTAPEAHAVIALATPIWRAIRVKNSPERSFLLPMEVYASTKRASALWAVSPGSGPVVDLVMRAPSRSQWHSPQKSAA
jgi:hypothetical protein